MVNVFKRCCVALLLTLGVLVGPTAASYAVEPFAMPDSTDVVARGTTLSDTDQVKLQDAVVDARQQLGLEIYFVFVDTYGDLTPAGWTQGFVSLSHITGLNYVVITVATQQRDLYLGQGGSLSTYQMQTLMNKYLIPSLQQSDASWGNIGPAAVEGLHAVRSSQPAGSTTDDNVPLGLGAFILTLVAAAAVAIYYVVRRLARRKRNNEAAMNALANPQWDAPNPLGAVPLGQLHQRSKEVLIATDNAIRQANQAVITARQEFGDAAVEQYQIALQKASAHLRQAFTIRQELDDAFPETQQQQHQMLTELLRHCDDAGKLLKENATQFEQMRDIMTDPQPRIANLTLRTVEARARLEPAHQTISSLQQRYKRLNLETIEANVLGAEENITLAEKSLDDARQGLKRPSEEHYPVAPAIVQAEKLLAQAERLLAAVDHADEDITHAQASLQGQKEELTKTLAEAESFLASPLAKNSTVNTNPVHNAVNLARQALKRAESRGEAIPLPCYNELVAADTSLQSTLISTEGQANTLQRQKETVRQAIITAQHQVRAAQDLVNTRTNIVQATARTRLSQAQTHLRMAEQVAETDYLAALQEAQKAMMMAQEATQAAAHDQRTYATMYYQDQRTRSGSNVSSFLGGMLLGNLLSGGSSYNNGWSAVSNGAVDIARALGNSGGFSGIGGSFGEPFGIGGKF